MSLVEALEVDLTISCEVFPPRDAQGLYDLDATLEEFADLRPDFISVTYGAGGTGRGKTVETIRRIVDRTGIPVVGHLTGTGETRQSVRDLISEYEQAGIQAVLALAGDPNPDLPDGEFRYATDLIRTIREASPVEIGVAAFPEVHPRSRSTHDDRRYLARKLEAADFGVTQFFFDERDYWRMVDSLSDWNCSRPVIPGVMVVANPVKVRQFAKMNGTRIPEKVFAALTVASESDRIEMAVRMAAAQSVNLLKHGAPGVHLYTLNRADVVAGMAAAFARAAADWVPSPRTPVC
jgi:methylenetetrahydrofolate reductase (NADPH)